MVDTSQEHIDIHKLHGNIHRMADFFPGQRDNEKVMICIRRHWLSELGIFLRFLALVILIPLITISIFSFFSLDVMAWRWVYFTLFYYLIYVWLYIFIEFLKNELSVLLITNERIIDNVQVSLFNHQVSEGNIDRIQDVIGFTHGILGTFFNVGRLEIQTAGLEPFRFYMVKAPQLTARKVLNMQRQSLQRRRNSDFGEQRKGAQEERRGTGGREAKVKKRPGDSLSDAEIMHLRGVPMGQSRASDQRKPKEGLD